MPSGVQRDGASPSEPTTAARAFRPWLGGAPSVLAGASPGWSGTDLPILTFITVLAAALAAAATTVAVLAVRRARRAERALARSLSEPSPPADRDDILTSAEDELRRANAQLDATNRELEAFSYSVSHDLRAPLRSITGFAAALTEDHADELSGEATRHVDRIRRAADRMGHLIDDLLTLSRAVRTPMRLDEVDLSRVAEAVVHQLREEAPERSVEVSVAGGLVAYGDRWLLRLVVENLLSNAWKFTRDRGAATISFERMTPDEAAAVGEAGKDVFLVRDDGVGFDPAHADRLFRPFQRLHSEDDFPGTGIGLATVQRIVRRHGGRVWLESEPGGGTTAYFTLA